MPNWVQTDVELKGNENQIEELMKIVREVSDRNTNDLFQTMLPMPECYEEWDTTNYPYGKGIDDEDKAMEYKVATEYQLEHYGVVGWYDWHCKYWGTKWDVEYLGYGDKYMGLQTAWSVAYPFFQTISQRYPEVEFVIDFADEDIGNNCGRIELQNGEGYFLFPQNSEAFANRVWGYDEDPESNELEESQYYHNGESLDDEGIFLPYKRLIE